MQKITDILLGILCGIIGGIWSYYYLNNIRPDPQTLPIVTIDIRKLIDTEKEKIIHSDHAEEDLRRFSNNLHEAIEKASNNRIVIVKDAVISGATDITEEVGKEIRGKIKK